MLSVGLGFVNEYRAELAAIALHSGIHHQTVAWRDGVRATVDVADVVPGDVVELAIGAIVPADVRLIEATRFECDEAVLTGESTTATKSSTAVVIGDSPLDLASCAFMGTIVHQGTATAVVVATGSGSAFGKIAAGLSAQPALTAFQVGLKSFSKLLVVVAGVLTVGIFVINVALSRPLIDALLFSLAIAIGITPQLLPAIVSVSLATGSRQLARSKVLVKRLVTIEDLGNIELLFTDKTGTLTEGAITFDRAIDAAGLDSPEAFLLGLLCNEAEMTSAGPVGGNSLDQAMYLAPRAAQLLTSGDGPGAYTRRGALPFDHDRQLASVTVTGPGGTVVMVTKGAPEVVISRCDNLPATATAQLDLLFADGARTVAVATRAMPDDPPDASVVPSAADVHPCPDVEHDLSFVGFLTFIDRPKPDAGRRSTSSTTSASPSRSSPATTVRSPRRSAATSG